MVRRIVTAVLVFVLCLLSLHGAAQEAPADEMQNQIRFVTAEWAHEVRGERDYDPNPTGVFSRNSRAYAYLEVEGFSVGKSGVGPIVDLRVDVVLRSNNGLKLYSQENLVEYTLHSPAEPPDRVWFYIWVDVPWWAPRTSYQAEVIVRDLVGETKVIESSPIVIE
ncbi:MAG: hypothetical protein GX205_11320 [Firmicutes bacterium]|nr:hypothetical protein [Bacillota bacterium]